MTSTSTIEDKSSIIFARMCLLWVFGTVLALSYPTVLLGRALRRKLLQRQTCVDDIPYLGCSRLLKQKIKGTAVICGGR